MNSEVSLYHFHNEGWLLIESQDCHASYIVRRSRVVSFDHED
jgi:hypothetical protein